MSAPGRRPLVAGNWKMHLGLGEARALAGAVLHGVGRLGGCEVAVAPPATALAAVAEVLRGSGVGIIGQDVFYEDQGAFTGALAAPQLADAGCTHVLVGHSERRLHFGETLEGTRRRVAAALRHGLRPVLCVGESAAERQAGRTEAVVREQLQAAVAGLDGAALGRLVLAYEPVWAIGTGAVATPAQAQAVHAALRAALAAQDAAAAAAVRILYGGSVKPDNAAAILAEADVDGALVGGASLQADAFVGIAAAARRP